MKATTIFALLTIIAEPVLGQIQYVGNNGGTGFPLGLCEGGKCRSLSHTNATSVGFGNSPQPFSTDCDNDDECADDLRCFQRSGTEQVPGCGDSSSYSDSDFCYQGLSFINYRGNNGDGSHFPLGECEG